MIAIVSTATEQLDYQLRFRIYVRAHPRSLDYLMPVTIAVQEKLIAVLEAEDRARTISSVRDVWII